MSSTLESLAARFRGARTPDSAVDADGAWHDALIAHCDRPRTAAILRHLRTAAARYEFRFFSDLEAVAASANQHDAILDALRRAEYREAAVQLRQNWEQGLDRISERFVR